jgi:hypothetical protein
VGALAFDGSQHNTPVGHFVYRVDEDQWSWSDGVYRLHGYEPRGVMVTTELVMQHKHPDDRARTSEVLDTVIADGEPFSCYHRIVDAKERVHYVLVVGHGMTGAGGRVEQVSGFFVDMTEVRRNETQAEVDLALVRISQTRSVIDQAKGIVMCAKNCGADEAFEILRTYSSHKNVKLHDLAERLVDAAGSQVMSDDSLRRRVTGFLDGLEPFSRSTTG